MSNNLKEEIDKIVFRCFEQGRYWGTGLGENIADQDYKPKEPIDRTEAVEKFSTLINQKEKEAEVRGLENLLDGSAEGATCICESAGLSVCDHNWSLCNVVRDRIKQLKEELKGGKD